MPRTLRFHLDEHLSDSLASEMRRRGIDVTTSAEVQLLGADDPVQVEFCRAHGRVMITRDADYPDLHASGVNHTGILFCPIHTLSEILRMTEIMWELLEPAEM